MLKHLINEMENEMKKSYGYMRVSTKEQNEDRQRIKLKEAGIDDKNLFLDKQSGKDFNRSQYKTLLGMLDSDSVLFVTSIDRLGRNYTEIIKQWKLITQEKKADIVVLDMPLLDTRRQKDLLGTLISDLVLSLLSYVAETERSFIRERQREGIEAAHRRGVKFGRPPAELPCNFQACAQAWKSHELSLSQAARVCGMAKSTFWDKAKGASENL